MKYGIIAIEKFNGAWFYLCRCELGFYYLRAW